VVDSIDKSAPAGHRQFPWTGPPLIDAVEVDAEYADLLILDSNRVIYGLDLDTGVTTKLAEVGHELDAPPHDPKVHDTSRLGLHADRYGRFAVAAQDFGSTGVCFNLATGDIVARLDAGESHPNTVPASIAFIEHQTHGTVLIHRTAWNRLDATALPSEECLTSRQFEVRKGNRRPAHYLDYFHGAIHPSPTGRWLLCDGWVWQPVAVPYVFDLAAWLDGDIYRPEDDYGRGQLFSYGDDWTSPCVWLDDTHAALWWKPEPDAADDYWFTGHPMAEVITRGEGGVFIVDVEAAMLDLKPITENLVVLPVPVPNRPDPFDWPTWRLFRFGDQLAVYDGTSTTLWDWHASQPVAKVDGIAPRLVHKKRGTLIELDPDGVTEVHSLTVE